MKRIGILTLYYQNYNYGGLLQAYALQHTIEGIGGRALQISYALETGYPRYSPIKYKMRKCAAQLIHLIRFRGWEIERLKRSVLFNKFAEMIPHTRTVNAKNIGDLNGCFDCFVFGSDQIWNPIGWQPILLGSFVSDRKYLMSYAASIARDSLSNGEYDFIGKFLKRFDRISVREINAVNYLNKKFPELNVCLMPDPVFLLSREEWEKVISDYSKDRMYNERYILCYFLGRNEENRDNAIRYAEALNMKALFVSHFEKAFFNWEKRHLENLTGSCGPADFLNYIYYAEMIITDSFHGAVFSLIFEKPFYVMRRFLDSDKNSMNSRVVSLLQSFDLEQRLVDELDVKTPYEISNREMEHIREIKINFRDNGIEYLQNSIQP